MCAKAWAIMSNIIAGVTVSFPLPGNHLRPYPLHVSPPPVLVITDHMFTLTKRKLTKWWSTISVMSRKRTATSQINKTTLTHGVWNTDHSLGQAWNCVGVTQANGFQPTSSLIYCM